MCGIVGYVGKREALPILLDGLKRLEYRGYDSAGVAVFGSGAAAGMALVRAPGKLKSLEEKLLGRSMPGTLGIGHTRWATHGPPIEKNAHPHSDCREELVVVHNGIIENHDELRTELRSRGHIFKSDTDTEVLAHLLEEAVKNHSGQLPPEALSEATRLVLKKVRGTYGLVVAHKNCSALVVTRLGSPIVLGISSEEYFVASDPSAILAHTRQMLFLDDGEMVVLSSNGYKITSLDNRPIVKKIQEIDWTVEAAEKNGQPHFMLKEMLEQPETVRNSIRGRLNLDDGTAVLGGLRDVSQKLRELDRLIVVGCGSAYYAGLVGEYMLEEFAGVPVEVELASEFRYRQPIITPRTAVLAVSQSGETLDTLSAVREAKLRGALTLGIVNVVGSTIARETDAGVYNHAGPEIGVASTKAFVSQCTVFALLTLFLGRQRQMSIATSQTLVRELERLPELLAKIIAGREEIKRIALKYIDARDFLFLGRKYSFPIALEGALKLKEVSYTHSEGYAAGEMKHGTIALIDKNFPSVVICPQDSVYEKTKSNIAEIKARGGRVIVVTTEGNDELRSVADEIIFLPKTSEMLTPLLAIVPLQLFAYYVAVARGLNPDQPRNLAKSVTVE